MVGRIILYIAASVDGFIADEDGGVEWLEEFDDGASDGYEAFFADVDCLVVGSNTYEQIRSFGEWPYEDRPAYVLTRRDLPRATDAVEFYDGNVTDLSAELDQQYDRIWLVGGARLARSFLRANQIDDLRLSIVPILLGDGISLFDGSGDRRRLHHLETETRESGIVELRYEVSPH
ncbi:dihydrofolate reductase family protein [Natronobacterium texcoconense]|uniref:Dihydrofolate reductase n=1 Tax=Natronobacterium texcoconense TaxID=1095778 RepID=A0A1H1H0Q8_NATTX|nr:dihydrofolate reductase family protein [Natronobacterium texcoconense]SDR19075.1 Dihydrofolate reductase [Natronobacterium texcoconense]